MTRGEAVVTGYSHGGGGLDSYISVYRLVTNDGRIISVRGHLESSQPADNPGDKVPIYYDTVHMERGVVIDRFGERWFGLTILAALGAAFVAIGVIVRVASGRRAGHSASNKPSMAARRAARNRQILAAGGVAVAIGTFCAAVAGLMFFHQLEISRNYGRAVGSIVDTQARVSQTGLQSRFKSAVIEFVAADGRKFEFAQGSSATGALASDKVDVRYDPGNPQRAIVDSFWDRWAAPSIFTALGALFLAAGVFVCATTLRSGRAGKRVRTANNRAQT